jgi:protein ImuB
VYPEPIPAAVFTDDCRPVVVDDRGVLNGEPARFCPTGRPRSSAELQPIQVWAGPWPVSERWWDETAARRVARFQVVGADGSAWLLVVERGQWFTEASYD